MYVNKQLMRRELEVAIKNLGEKKRKKVMRRESCMKGEKYERIGLK